ncbi:MAG: hydantoinase B/oxoprolinase family protein [Alphaproteobacteria bacterium]|nr:hydantoinase B/oxoprolinase family protein [Alphaproteobacteria bacterium]
MTDRFLPSWASRACGVNRVSLRRGERPGQWRFWVDRGGTFTDVLARGPDGTLREAKLLSQAPAYPDAAVEGIRRLMGLGDGPVPPEAVDEIRLGTTVATNALLTRSGARTAFVTTEGFGDALLIGTQARPDIFALRIEKPAPLFAEVLEVAERVTAEGEVRAAPDEATVRRGLEAARAKGCEAAAIAFVHAWRHPAHERAVAAWAREIFPHVRASHETSELMRFLPRAETTVADAYLAPVMARYLASLREALGWSLEDARRRLFFMRSNGGLAGLEAFGGKDAVLSGPAGGVVGMARTGEAAGFARLIGFDMGGTSTDVARYAGAFERTEGRTVAGVRLAVPMLDIHTVAAGGGSVLRFDGERLRVGPESAGADPGPAAYGRGGPLTVTDANLLLGRLQAEHFPKVFGPGGDAPLDLGAVRAGFDRLAAEMGARLSPEEIAEGALAIAVETMSQAIRTISIARGHDAREHALSCFGGAGGQHAARVAQALGMRTVYVHPQASLLSALGLGLSARSEIGERTLEVALGEEGLAAARAAADELDAQNRAGLQASHADDEALSARAQALLRSGGSDTTIPVPLGAPDEMAAAYARLHESRFGFAGEADLRIAAVRVETAERAPDARALRAVPPPGGPAPSVHVRLFSEGGWSEAPLRAAQAIGPDARIAGPALLVAPHTTVVVERGWTARRLADGGLVLSRDGEAESAATDAECADPIRLELYNRRFMAIAEQMGAALEMTASSVNIKERLDFSCALFDAQARLVANAPHIPVHLGSMGAAVAAVREATRASLRPGDVYATNDPYRGGTHLPDITVVMPVYPPAEDKPAFWIAARGHHADIGGLTPGSMPASSRTLEEEGIVLSCLKIVSGGRLEEAVLRAALAAGPNPARNPDQNVADIRAQIAACRQGADALVALCGEVGRETVAAFMGHVQANGEAAVRRTISRLRDGDALYTHESGTIVVRVRIDRAGGRARLDFTGTGGMSEGNRNAPLAIVRAAALYVFRCLVGDDIPLNDGCLVPLDIAVPEGSLINPRAPAAVVAGNVETSQAVVNALLLALGAEAASQGTMNNLTLGDASSQYYETLCGGAGAGEGFAGADAVHTHMTNSRLTDVEILETRFPVLVRSFSIRRGSGGAGRWRGGDGAVRVLEARRPLTLSLLTSHRSAGPPGLLGGAPGAPGRNAVRRADGRLEALAPSASAELLAGDAVVVETPGGGGFGRKA